MCGILAYFNSDGIGAGQLANLTASLKKISHRGPDGEGITLINTRTGAFHNLITDETPQADLTNKINIEQANNIEFDLFFGHRRLSIIDVSVNGHQPMVYENGNWLIFNGEIYNYIELREELKSLNFKFKTDSDTEVIHAAYQAWGSDCISKFNGMFSIVIYDSKKRELFSGSDRFGVKPMYYYKTQKELLFVSELVQLNPLNLRLTYNQNTISGFLNNISVDGGETFYKEINRHPSSHFSVIPLTKDSVSMHTKKYYEIDLKPSALKSNDIIDNFKELFESAVKLRLRSDVPLGFSVSGGLDSSAVLYTALKYLNSFQEQQKPVTFSAIFPGLEGDESYFIKLIEKDLNITSFYTNPLEEFNFGEFEKIIYHQNFPINSTSYYAEWSVAKLIHSKNIKVVLVGQGGDELLAGYHYHFYRYCRELILKGKITKYLALAKKYAEIKNVDVNLVHKNVLNEVKLAAKFKLGLTKYGRSLVNKWDNANTLVELLKLDLNENIMPTLLRADDRNSMAFSVETRHPFLDYRLVDFCFSIPSDFKIKDGWQKSILREAVKEMPEEIKYRKDKKGYTTPHNLWIDKYRSEFEEYLNYLPVEYKGMNSEDEFKKYSLGAWFKLQTR